MMQNVALRRLNKLLGEDEVDHAHKLFIILDCAIVDVALLDESNEEAAAIATYWEMRGVTGSLENFDLFSTLLSEDMADVLWFSGYNETRAKLPEAPEETRQPLPDKDSPLEKRGKKRTKPTG
jgi:hypothetical protein